MSKRIRLVAAALPGLAIALGASTPAQAAVPAAAFPQAIAIASLKSALPCVGPVAPSTGAGLASQAFATSKSAAILGGQPSKLELLRMQQSAKPQPPVAAAVVPAALPIPAAAPMRGMQENCVASGPAQSGTSFVRVAVAQSQPTGNDFLASKRLSIKRTSFDTEWKRVERAGLGRKAVTRYLGKTAPGASEAALAQVNAFANRRIRFVEDRDLYGRADYWASAGTTLKRGAGDCEDIAIVKMQMLAALGVPRSDMYLTVARDLVRNADHALLVVKLDGQHWVLDYATDRLLDGALGHDYRPIMSFSATGKWLHGYAPS
jgi:predicted transglutaminase-like cysteine proteinase